MSSKNIAVRAVVIVAIITFIALIGETYITLQAINPVAIIAAITVAVICFAWFRKTMR